MKKMLLSATLFILGFSIFLYPTVSNYMNQRVYETEIINYEKRVENLKDEDLRNKFKVMQSYNESLK
ncbi:class C sortase, partial [Bacillus sp. SN10]